MARISCEISGLGCCHLQSTSENAIVSKLTSKPRFFRKYVLPALPVKSAPQACGKGARVDKGNSCGLFVRLACLRFFLWLRRLDNFLEGVIDLVEGVIGVGEGDSAHDLIQAVPGSLVE